jgi:hypothetical protein
MNSNLEHLRSQFPRQQQLPTGAREVNTIHDFGPGWYDIPHARRTRARPRHIYPESFATVERSSPLERFGSSSKAK